MVRIKLGCFLLGVSKDSRILLNNLRGISPTLLYMKEIETYNSATPYSQVCLPRFIKGYQFQFFADCSELIVNILQQARISFQLGDIYL